MKSERSPREREVKSRPCLPFAQLPSASAALRIGDIAQCARNGGLPRSGLQGPEGLNSRTLGSASAGRREGALEQHFWIVGWIARLAAPNCSLCTEPSVRHESFQFWNGALIGNPVEELSVCVFDRVCKNSFSCKTNDMRLQQHLQISW